MRIMLYDMYNHYHSQGYRAKSKISINAVFIPMTVENSCRRDRPLLRNVAITVKAQGDPIPE